MKNIGLDFGTTNSIISYYDEKKNTIEKFEQSSMESYIPSYYAISKEEGDISIGSDAKSKIGNGDYYIYSKFKMLISETDTEVLEDFDWPENANKTPVEITEEYISMLINDYCSANKISINEINNFTVTVPEIWLKDGNHKGRETLLKICNKILGGKAKLISEPVAASIYYSYQYHKTNNKYFLGHLLVCDFGGGTLDISLSKLNGNKVEILESTGSGKLTQESLGTAGVAYDDAVVQDIYKENNYNSPSNEEYYEDIIDFEYKKINQKSTIDIQLARYLKENSRNRALFNVSGNKCQPSNLCMVFDKKIKNIIIDKLDKISQKFSTHGVDINDPVKFKVLLVGGFCNFYLVEKTIKDFFFSVVSTDFRFDSSFIDADKNLAIAKGAAVFSAGLITSDASVPLSIGVTTYIRSEKDDEIKKTNTIYLEKGTSLEKSLNPNYSSDNDKKIELKTRDDLKKSLKFYIDSEDGPIPFVLSPLSQYLPNPEFGNKWVLAFTMDENRCYHIHIKDEREGKEKKINLGDLLEKKNEFK